MTSSQLHVFHWYAKHERAEVSNEEERKCTLPLDLYPRASARFRPAILRSFYLEEALLVAYVVNPSIKRKLKQKGFATELYGNSNWTQSGVWERLFLVGHFVYHSAQSPTCTSKTRSAPSGGGKIMENI